MTGIWPTSPWYPLMVAASLQRKDHKPAITPVPFQYWLLWRARCVVPPQTLLDMRFELAAAQLANHSLKAAA